MLVRLSSTSPYICDISLGPIEQANRMSSAQTRKNYLEIKESFPHLQPTRTPLKLLAPDEVPMDTSIATTTTTTDNNPSRQQSLQPVWYTEQSIVDDNIEQQQRNSMKSPSHRLDLTRSTLPTIESNSPEIEDEIIEQQSISTRTSLMRKSSTFTIEQQPSINIPSSLNESEKENDLNTIITSTQEDPTRHPTEPSDESFRALEHLLGLGSTNINLTMTTTTQESPKSNHESLSLTIVTPTELINQTANSLHLSYAPAGGGSLPSSQNILLMPTIESITEPSINSTIPPPFMVDSSDSDEPSSTAGTVINQETQNEDTFNYTDENTTAEEEEEDDFSFELNDFSNDESTPPLPPPPAPPIITVRAPTSADVAYRALIKPRTGGRISQPIKAESPLAKTLPTRSSVPTNLTSRVLRSSTRLSPTESIPQNQSIPDDQCFVNENKIDDDYPRIELVEVVSLSEDEDIEPEPNLGITLNLTESPTSAEEADRSASSSCSSYISIQQDITTPTIQKMPVLSREFTYNTPTQRKTRSSERRRSILITRPSEPIILEEDNLSLCSIPSSKSILSTLSTNPTIISEAPPIILQKSLAGSASPSPNPTPIITIRQSERLSSNLSPRRNINPLHSSTPSIRNKSLQIVSIGEQEQVSTTVPQQLNIDLTTDDIEMIDNEQQIDVSIPIQHVVDEGIQTSPEKPPQRIDIGVQTTPSLDPLSRRRFQTVEQQTTPIVARSSSSSSCQTTPMVIQTLPKELEQQQQQQQQQITPLHSKAMMHLRRNVRFQFTPSTDARLAAKEKLEEEQQQKPSKQEIQIITDNEREEDTEDEIKNTKKKITTSKKKKILPITTPSADDSSEEMNESPVRRTTRNQPRNDTDVTTTTHSKKKTSKRSNRNEIIIVPEPEPEPEIIVTTTSPPLPTKRVNRKRPNPKASPPETTSPTEPVIKRPKTTKTTEVKQPVRDPSPEVPPTRGRGKTSNNVVSSPEIASPTEPVIKRSKTTKTTEVKQPVRDPSPEVPPTRTRTKTSNNTVSPPEPVERPPIPKKVKKTSIENNSNENLTIPVNNKRKNLVSTMKKGKRRLHSTEQDEGLNTADEEETIQTISLPPLDEIITIDLNQEEREKIEGLTVAELKNRLNTHGENIPKGARKADLAALLIKIETNLLKERSKEAEIVAAVPANLTSRKTRRKK